MAKKRKKGWSHNAGEPGSTWVRAYEDRPGKFYLEWFEPVLDEDGQPVMAAHGRTGELIPQRSRKRALIKGCSDRKVAKERAEALSERFATMEVGDASGPLTVQKLITEYLKEVTPTKGESKQGHDHRAARVFLAFFDSQPAPQVGELDRRSERCPLTLDRIDFDRFAAAREAGEIPGWEGVRARQVEYDLKFLISVLGWACGLSGEDWRHLPRNPWGAEIRRAQKWKMPKELNPNRPGMTDEIRELLITHAPHWQMEVALLVERHTRRRGNAVRQLWWSDLDFVRREIRWRGETDKCGKANVTPMRDEVLAALQKIPVRGIGDTPVFASATDPTQPTSRHTFQTWMRRAKERAGVKVRGLGYHGEKRAGVRDPEFRDLPAAIQEEESGTRYETLRRVYDQVTVTDIRQAQEEAKRRRQA